MLWLVPKVEVSGLSIEGLGKGLTVSGLRLRDCSLGLGVYDLGFKS